MKNISKYLLLLAFFAFSCGSNNSENADKAENEKELPNSITLSQEQLKSIGISTTSLEQKSIEKTIRLNGKVIVAPSHLVSISSMLGGRVKSIKVLPGSSFKKGQILAEIEEEKFIQLQQEYLITKAQSASAKLDYSRQKELNENKTSSDKSFQAAEANYKTLHATQKALEEKLRLIYINPNNLTSDNISSTMVITAPFDGVVSKISSNTGQYLNASDIVMELINNNGLLLNLKAFESDIMNLEIGQTIKVYTNKNTAKKLEAKIVTVVPNIENDGSFDVIAKLKNYDANIISGLYINSDVVLKNFNTTSLPEESIVTYENANYVFEVVDNNVFKLIPINIGTSSNGFTEIMDSPKLQNKKIVSKGAYDLLMALKNTVEE
jgi:cobalt-zinc-cadmium efflux system membrane fusion protein